MVLNECAVTVIEVVQRKYGVEACLSNVETPHKLLAYYRHAQWADLNEILRSEGDAYKPM